MKKILYYFKANLISEQNIEILKKSNRIFEKKSRIR
jgi:hypothetical protein